MGEVLHTLQSDALLWLRPNRERTERACCLVCIHPANRLGQVIELSNAEYLVGREADCDIELSDDLVSRRHAVLRPTPNGFAVIDLQSTNGTYVNDVKVEMHELAPSDRLRFGNQIFKFLSPDCFEAEYFENAYRMMTTDGLTQAHNKRYLLEVAERELRHAGRTGRPLSMLMIDVDHFKAINDTYGHLAGDEVLIELSRRLRTNLRGDELLARYGGEEFCLMMPDTTLAEALQAAERFRGLVAATCFATAHAAIEVTVSIGAASTQTMRPGAGLEVPTSELVEQADKQLYAAKRAGRNRVAG